MRSWYVVKTKPRQEEQTALILGLRDLETYLPKIAARPCIAKHGAPAKLEPLFPGYLFARLNMRSIDWMLARSAPGVAYFLGADDAPAAVPDELVDGVRLRVEEHRKRGWKPSFRSGERVVITSGPMAGLEAVFDGTLSASGRSRVLVECISRLVPVIVSAAALRRAS